MGRAGRAAEVGAAEWRRRGSNFKIKSLRAELLADFVSNSILKDFQRPHIQIRLLERKMLDDKIQMCRLKGNNTL